jgi:hypothetical protein
VSPEDLHWLAGLLEGEGSFLKPSPSRPASPRVQVVMTDRDVLEHVAALVGVSVYAVPVDSRNADWHPCYRVIVNGQRATQLMRVLRPLMGERRQHQIDAAMAAAEEYPTIRRHLGQDTKREIAERFARGDRAPVIAADYGIRREHVYRIVRQLA